MIERVRERERESEREFSPGFVIRISSSKQSHFTCPPVKAPTISKASYVSVKGITHYYFIQCYI